MIYGKEIIINILSRHSMKIEGLFKSINKAVSVSSSFNQDFISELEL